MSTNRHIKEYYRFINEDLKEDAMSDIFRGVHAAIDIDDLIPLTDLVGNPKLPTQKEIDAAVNYLGIDPEYLFYDPNGLDPIIYWKDFIYYGFPGGLDMQALKMLRAKEYLDNKRERVDRMLKKGYGPAIAAGNKKIIIPMFIKMYDKIHDNKKYDTFIDIYVRSEYGFDMFPKEIIKDVMTKRKLSSGWRGRMREWEKTRETNPDGTVTIYRGQNVQSAKEEDAFSWTTDEKIAKFFATRFGEHGKVIEKNIDPKEIVDYLPDRGESEVIIIPDKYK